MFYSVRYGATFFFSNENFGLCCQIRNKEKIMNETLKNVQTHTHTHKKNKCKKNIAAK